MKTAFRIALSLVALAAAWLGQGSRAGADPGLLLVAHGSPSPAWNQPVLEFGRRAADELLRQGRFKAVRLAMLEAAQPDVPTALAELEAAGCTRIVAVPLFVAPSGHTHFDVPAVLGLYTSPRTAATLAAEQAHAARPKVPVTLTQTMCEGDLLEQYAADQVRKLSQRPKDEALVILVHGDPEHHLLIDRRMRQIATYCCGTTGIAYGDWAYIGVGQEYPTQGLAAIHSALEKKGRVLVVGLYLGSSAQQIHERSAAMAHRLAQHQPDMPSIHERDVAFSREPILSYAGLLDWVQSTANAALEPVRRP